MRIFSENSTLKYYSNHLLFRVFGGGGVSSSWFGLAEFFSVHFLPKLVDFKKNKNRERDREEEIEWEEGSIDTRLSIHLYRSCKSYLN